MALDLKDLKTMHDRAYSFGQVTRERASDDLVFYHVTQWDDNLLEDSNLLFRGQFDILRKAGRQILGDLAANPVQVDFRPKDEERDDGAELLDGLYRADDRRNESQEAYGYAAQDSVVCGFGAWELYTEYKSRRNGDSHQVIRREYIPEACNTVFWDPNARRLDKSDAKYVSVLTAYSEDGYLDLVEDLTGERPDSVSMQSFKHPEESYAFPWVGGESKKIYVTRFYITEVITDKVVTLVDPIGVPLQVLESQLADEMDDLISSGYEIQDEKEIERNQVTRYVASGAEILDESIIAGEFIPVVPVYGERAIVEGEEHYEGIVRLAKDPQRLRNFQMSYLADIVSKSPRAKPIFTAEQIQGFEDLYNVAGSDNDYPYLLQNFLDANGNQLPIGPVSQMPDTPIPQALAASIELTRQAVEDVANPGLPQDIADPDLSGKAVIALQNRMDQQSYIYQHNLKHAKRRDGEIYASMASEIYDAPQKVTVASQDGTTQQVEVMHGVYDGETGEYKVINDITNMEFEVYSDIGPSYTSQKEATIDRLGELAAGFAATDPAMQKALALKIIELSDGVNDEDIKDYARKQLILTGFKEPETEEDEAMLAQASQQAQQPDAATLLAQAEMMKGQAAMQKEQREAVKDAAKIQNDQAQTQIDVFEAQTDRMEAQVNAQKVGAEINYKNIQSFGEQLDNAAKAGQLTARRMMGARLVQ